VSSAASEASLGFWQRNRKGVFLIGGCLVLLLASRAYTGRAREAKKEAKVDKLTQADGRDEMDKNSAIAGLQARLTAEQQRREAQEQQDLASQMAAHQLTAAQLEALASGGVGTSGRSAAAVAGGTSPVVGGNGPGACAGEARDTGYQLSRAGGGGGDVASSSGRACGGSYSRRRLPAAGNGSSCCGGGSSGA
jgi:hypothetical protein